MRETDTGRRTGGWGADRDIFQRRDRHADRSLHKGRQAQITQRQADRPERERESDRDMQAETGQSQTGRDGSQRQITERRAEIKQRQITERQTCET